MEENSDRQTKDNQPREIERLTKRVQELEALQQHQAGIENQLLRSEQRLQLALTAARMGSWEWEIATNDVYWSDGVETIFGLEPGKFAGTVEAYFELIHAEDLADVQQAINTSLETGNRYEIDHRLVLADGTIRWLSCRGNVFRDRQNHPIRMAGTVMDVTEQKLMALQLAQARNKLEHSVQERTAELKQLANELAQQKQMLDTIMNNTPDRYYIFDKNGRYLYANPSGLKAQRLTREQVIGKTWRDLNFPTSVGEKFDAELATVFRTGKKFVGQTQFSTPQMERYVEYILNPVYDENNVITTVISSVRDISERKQAEAILQQAQKMESLGILAGGVAHDFNNLLVAMLGQTTLAVAKLDKNNSAKPHIDKAVKAAKRAVDLTRQMLAYSGKGHFEIQPLNLGTLIPDYQDLFTAAVSKNVQLQVSVAEDSLYVEADEGQIQQVLMNLILNGAEAIGDEQGEVKLTVYTEQIDEKTAVFQTLTGNILQPGSYICLEVTDNGPGIPLKTLTKIFDPFFSTKFTGRGLGLASVLGIVRGHQGGIQVDSKLGVGTTFKVSLPAWLGEKPIPRQQEPIPTRQQFPDVVLVIDDEEAVREGVSDILELAGIEVLTAEDGYDGVELFKNNQQRIKLILLDLSMPVLSGEETLNLLQEVVPNVPVALSSGYSEEEVARRFAGKRLTGFIQKPYTVDTLIEKVTTFMQYS